MLQILLIDEYDKNDIFFVYLQLLKGRHMMVRVGGGWDTLEHFLERHDPCQVRVLGRDVTPSGSRSNSRSSGLNRLGLSSNSSGSASGGHQAASPRRASTNSPVAPSEGFLHIRAKYRSPPPARS